jgi:hypothetical protein
MLLSGTDHGARITLVTAGVRMVRPDEMRMGNAGRADCWWTGRANEWVSGSGVRRPVVTEVSRETSGRGTGLW